MLLYVVRLTTLVFIESWCCLLQKWALAHFGYTHLDLPAQQQSSQVPTLGPYLSLPYLFNCIKKCLLNVLIVSDFTPSSGGISQISSTLCIKRLYPQNFFKTPSSILMNTVFYGAINSRPFSCKGVKWFLSNLTEVTINYRLVQHIFLVSR